MTHEEQMATFNRQHRWLESELAQVRDALGRTPFHRAGRLHRRFTELRQRIGHLRREYLRWFKQRTA